MSPTEYISQQLPDRQAILTALHEAVMANDKSVTPIVEPMMGKEMIIYKEDCTMKYALASVKQHMSVHCLPMYMNPDLHIKYEVLLPGAKFQKGCFNFTDGAAVPVEIAGRLFADCATVNIAEVLANRKKKK